MLLSFVILTTVYICTESKSTEQERIFRTLCGSEVLNNSTTCHFLVPKDDLPPVDEEMVGVSLDESLFFIESSCNGGLNFRQACSVEAAARIHIYRHIYVLFAGPVPKFCLNFSPMSDILKYQNVKFLRLHIIEYLRNTPLESFLPSAALYKSQEPVYHTSDILKFATLYKYGGMYLDLDVIVTKPLDYLPGWNWLGRENNETIGSAVIGLSALGVGKIYSYSILRLMREHLLPITWAYNVSAKTLIREELMKFCTTPVVPEMSGRTCRGIQILDQSFFYPISEDNWDEYFDPIYDSYPSYPTSFHLWDSLSHDAIIYENSLYAQLIKNFCPVIYDLMR